MDACMPIKEMTCNARCDCKLLIEWKNETKVQSSSNSIQKCSRINPVDTNIEIPK